MPCRWDGAEKSNAAVIQLVREGKAIPVCPEQLGGLSTPRAPSERFGDGVINREGQDVTREFRLGAEIVLAIARKYGCEEAILKAYSPSCGKGIIYDGSFTGTKIEGDGITAEILMEHGIKVRTESEI